MSASLSWSLTFVDVARADDFLTATHGDIAAQVASAQSALKVTVKKISAVGGLCTGTNALPFTSFEDTNAHVLFGSQLVSEQRDVTGSCAVTVEIAVPAGYQFSRPHVGWREFFMSTASARGNTSVSYSYEGSSTAPVASTWTLQNHDDTITNATLDLWSPCNASNVVRFKAQLSPTLPGSPSAKRVVSIYNINHFEFLMSNVLWRKCGDS